MHTDCPCIFFCCGEVTIVKTLPCLKPSTVVLVVQALGNEKREEEKFKVNLGCISLRPT